MNDHDNDFTERLFLESWSDKLNLVLTSVSYTIHPDGFVDIEPTPAFASYFERLGLPKKETGFELDLNHSELTKVAKAFGIHADDPSVRKQLMENSRGMTGFEILTLALEGVSGQMGSLRSADFPGNPVRYVDLKHVVEAKEMLLPERLLVTSREIHQEMTRSRTLVRVGNKLHHGYVITCDKTPHNNASDRLAICAATLQTLGNVNQIIADRVVGFKKSNSGETSLVIIDSSRPSMELQAGSVSKTTNSFIARFDRREFESTRALQPAAPLLRKGNPAWAIAFIKARLLKGLAQDIASVQYGAPLVAENRVHIGRLAVPSHVCLEAYKNNSIDLLKNLPETITRNAKIYGVSGITEQDHSDIRDMIIEANNKSKTNISEIEALDSGYKSSKHIESKRAISVDQYGL